MLERMNLKARIEELSNNIDSQNKEIMSLKESNKKYKNTTETLNAKDKTIKSLETKNKELEDKLSGWETKLKKVSREAQEKLDVEKNNFTNLEQKLESEIKSHSDLKKNYSLLLDNMNQQQNSVSQDEHNNKIEELTVKHTEECSKLRQENENNLSKL